MQRRTFLLAGTIGIVSGWLGVGNIRPALAAAPVLRYRRSEREIQILAEDSLTWQVSLRLQESLSVGRVWQEDDLLCARIHNGIHSFVLTSTDGSLWQSS